MYDAFYNVLQQSLKALQIHYMDTDNFVLTVSEGNVDNEHMDLSNLDPRSGGFPDPPIKTNNKVPGNFKHEMGSKIIEEFLALTPKTYSFEDYPNKTKGKKIKNCNYAKHEEYYNELMYNTERTKVECRIQKVGDNRTTTKTSKISLNTFDDKRFYVKNIKSYPHGEHLYLFKRDLINKICEAGWGRASLVTSIKTKAPSLIKNASVKLLRRSLDGDKDLLVNNILEPAINDDRKLIEAAITLYNDLL